MPPSDRSGIYRFGLYEIDIKNAELRKAGVLLRLPEQAFQALVLLLEHAPEIVPRESLRFKLWPEGTFVDFDHGLNTVINKLRETLGDSASNPRFIETVARRGYRFIAAVEFKAVPSSPEKSGDAPLRTGEAASAQPTGSVLTGAHEVPAANRRNVLLLFLLLQIMYLIFYVTALARLGRIEDFLERLSFAPWIVAALVATASIGIPIRLYLISSTAFALAALTAKFDRMFPALLILDGLWALAPFLLVPQIGIGLALALTAVLLYAPFAQRTLLLIADHAADTI